MCEKNTPSCDARDFRAAHDTPTHDTDKPNKPNGTLIDEAIDRIPTVLLSIVYGYADGLGLRLLFMVLRHMYQERLNHQCTMNLGTAHLVLAQPPEWEIDSRGYIRGFGPPTVVKWVDTHQTSERPHWFSDHVNNGFLVDLQVAKQHFGETDHLPNSQLEAALVRTTQHVTSFVVDLVDMSQIASHGLLVEPMRPIVLDFNAEKVEIRRRAMVSTTHHLLFVDTRVLSTLTSLAIKCKIGGQGIKTEHTEPLLKHVRESLLDYMKEQLWYVAARHTFQGLR